MAIFVEFISYKFDYFQVIFDARKCKLCFLACIKSKKFNSIMSWLFISKNVIISANLLLELKKTKII